MPAIAACLRHRIKLIASKLAPTGGTVLIESSAVALLEFLLAATRARVVATNVLQCVAHRLLRRVVAVRAVYMTVVVVMVVMAVVMVVVAIRAMNVVFLVHQSTPESIWRELSRHCADCAREKRRIFGHTAPHEPYRLSRSTPNEPL